MRSLIVFKEEETKDRGELRELLREPLRELRENLENCGEPLRGPFGQAQRVT